jgi:Restriction Enzyme Adenine Methylase Associated
LHDLDVHVGREAKRGTQGRACGSDGCRLLEEGATLYARRHRVAERTAIVLSDGALDVDGIRYSSPSGASRAVSGTSENGWWFWLLDPESKRSLTHLWREYVDRRDVDAEDDDSPDDED